MSEFKGSKGEWFINKKALRNVRCNNITIANCSQGQSGANELEEIANALLISKALLMLEMLKEVKHELSSYIDKLQNLGYEVDFQTCYEIEQLIKEATEL